MEKKTTPVKAGIFAGIVVILLLLIFDYIEEQRFQEALRADVISHLSKVRAELEAEINANFYLTRGLIAFVASHPDLNQKTFHRLSDNLLRYRHSILNIGLAPGNILSFVHPLKGNEKAIGLDYEANKEQWPAVKKAIDSKKTVVAGPVNLVQGGSAFISRTPIFIDSGNSDQQQRYWGLASIVIDRERLFQTAGFYNPNLDIRIAIRGVDGLGAEGAFFDGEKEVFQEAPVVLDVLLPEGSWQLAAVPQGGWGKASPFLFWIRGGGAVLTLLVGFGVFSWFARLNQNQRNIEDARNRAEQARKALQESENFLNTIIENIPNMVFVKDAKTLEFVRFNKAGEELTGFSREELIGKTVYHLLPERTADQVTQKDRFVLDNRELLDIPLETLPTLNHGDRIFHTKKIPILDGDNQVEYLLGISEDITETIRVEEDKKKLEKQLHQAQKMEAIGLMAGGVAHDLNNILAAITGYPELLLRKLPAESDMCNPLKAILDSGKRAVAIVADLLTVAKGVASIRESVNLNSLIDEYLVSPECVNVNSRVPRVDITTALEPDLQLIDASSVHIKKCLMNLVNNAVAAIPESGHVRLTTWNESVVEQTGFDPLLDPGDYVALRVEDSGIGISKTDIEHIFEPFYTKKVMGKSGTGLGLAVVWNTVQDHAGKIFVESNPRGTSFKLYFPASHEKETVRIESEESNSQVGGGEHILVVDDETHLRDIASQMLQAKGYRVDTVASGEAAVAFVTEQPVDLVVIDMLMGPGMNGRQTYEAIVALNPQQKAIIASGFSESDDVRAALMLGAGGFINKPYTMEQLFQAVRDVLKSPAVKTVDVQIATHQPGGE